MTDLMTFLAFLFFHIYKHRMAFSRCHNFLGTCHSSGRGAATKICSGFRLTNIVLLEEADCIIVEPHCQQHWERGQDQMQWSMFFLELVEHLVHQVLGSVAGKLGFLQCCVTMTL